MEKRNQNSRENRGGGGVGRRGAASQRQPRNQTHTNNTHSGEQRHTADPHQNPRQMSHHQQHGHGPPSAQADNGFPNRRYQQRPPQSQRQGDQGSRSYAPQHRGQRPPYQQSSESSNKPHPQENVAIAEVPSQAISCAGIARGTLGTPGSLEVNYLNMNLDKMPDQAYHYDVIITPDRPKKFLRMAFEQCRLEKFAGIHAVAYDGNKSCYAAERLPVPIDHTLSVRDSGNREKSFHIEIKETKDLVIDMSSLRDYHNKRVFDKPMQALQVVDVVISALLHERAVRAGRSYFCRANTPGDLTQGYEVWTGLYQAPVLGELPLLNVDIVHKSFPRPSTLLEYLSSERLDPNYPLTGYRFDNVQRFLKDLDVQYEPPECFGSTAKKYKVLDLARPAVDLEFRLDDGTKTTVAAYYQSKGYTLKYPQLNCIKVGSTVRPISLPMELCSIVDGQVRNRKDGKRQTEKMIRFAATSTNLRKQKIMNLLSYFQHNASSVMRAFGIEIDTRFLRVPSRVLPPPCIEYANGKIVNTTRGEWSVEGVQFLRTAETPKDGHKWVIIYEKRAKSKVDPLKFEEVMSFRKKILEASTSLGMHLAKDPTIHCCSYSHNFENELRKFSSPDTALVFVVLNEEANHYEAVKTCAELRLGLLTQCVLESTIRFKMNKDRKVISNMLLKVNGKLNGTNHKTSDAHDAGLLKLMEPLQGVMYLGADVTHPSPEQRFIPSVVGVAASHDADGACYNMQYRLQKAKQEHIDDMETIVSHHLRVYHQNQKHYPQQIIYYRDGVSEGQFPKISQVEVTAIRNACRKLAIVVKITCLIVVKRHHTRFFPLSEPKYPKDCNNVAPGTVVDQHITHPNEKQFFLVSHHSPQGTARPARYNVLVDDSEFDIDLLQKLTYNLCHMFPRCNQAVSYATPAYLAHHAAFRGRVYINGAKINMRNLQGEYEARTIRPEIMERKPMYFI